VPLRIGAIAYTHYGSDPRVRREAEALAGRGDRITVWSLAEEGRPPQSVEHGVEVVRIAMPRYRGGRAAAYVGSYARFFAEVSRRLVQARREAPLDVVHVHTMPDFMVLAALIPKLTGAKVLLDMHDLMPDLYALKFGLERGGLAVRALELTQAMATSFADAVLCVHANQYDLLLAKGVPARKLSIVMNSADPSLFPPLPEVPSVRSGPIRVLYHGTVLHRYGVDLAVRAFGKARLLEPRLVMQVLGGGDYVPELKALAAGMGLGPEVITIPGVHRPLDEIAAAVRAGHIGIVPTRDDHEDSVLPTKLLEYVAVGIPSIAARTRCIGRFFGDAEVELVGVGDVDAMAKAIVRLAHDDARRAAMVKAAHAWEEKYGFEVNRGLLFRAVDALCFEKIAAERKSKQQAVEGKKTGTKKTPEKPSPKTKERNASS
jgi:glycosyltransferase involved in cell wall biosynthesis